jgi:hypothetical protein
LADNNKQQNETPSQEIQTKTIPAPIGGWNRKDALAEMDVNDAVVMDNFISTGGFVKLRNGYRNVIEASAEYTEITSLFTYASGGKNQLLFIAHKAGEQFADVCLVDDSKPVWTYTKVSPANDDARIIGTKWKELQFQNMLFLVSDGTDAPIYYDGSNYYKVNLTHDTADEIDLKNLTDIASYSKRLFFIEKGTLALWYTSMMGVISGKIEPNDLSNFSEKGGELVELEEWTRSGADDLSSMLVAVSSQGEVFMFQGTDPSSLDGWKLAGTYQLPAPVGYHCAAKMMGELVFATKGGYYTSSNLSSVKETTKDMAISDKIRGAIDELKPYYANDGWQITFLPSYNYLLINVPISENQANQYIYNLENKTWCRFTGIDAYSFTTFKDKVYFGGKAAGAVYEMFTAGTDNGLYINGAIQQAFSTFDIPQKKLVKVVSMNVGSPYKISMRVRLSCDFNLQPPCVVWTEGEETTSRFGTWNVSEWDTVEWGTTTTAETLAIQELTTYVDAIPSRYISVVLQVSLGIEEIYDIVWHSTTYSFETALQ